MQHKPDPFNRMPLTSDQQSDNRLSSHQDRPNNGLGEAYVTPDNRTEPRAEPLSSIISKNTQLNADA